ncbi:MAG: DegV family protein [Ardenticatenaceae bacterium]
MSIKVLTDGSVDLPENILEHYQIDVVPVSITIDGELFLGGVDISAAQFYERQRTANTLPTTTRPTASQFAEAFEKGLSTHDQVLCLSLSSALSQTYDEALKAAQRFPAGKVVVQDSRTLSGALGFQLVAAARAIQGGGNMEQARAAARHAHQNSEFFFALDDLSYLVKSGRIGRLTGTFGSFLNLKPINKVDKEKGTYVNVARVRSFNATMDKMVELAAEVVGEGQAGRFMVLHGQMDPEAQHVANMIQERFDARWLYVGRTSPGIGVHTGPRALAVIAARGDWE